MGMTSSGGNRQRSDINVTPLIDVLLVLLIIFMVIQPSVLRGLDALVPQPPKSPNTNEVNPLTVVVQVLANGADGTVYKINEDSVSKADIEPKLASIFAARANKVLFVKGDADLEFSPIAEVIDDAHQAGVDNIGIITPRAGSLQQ